MVEADGTIILVEAEAGIDGVIATGREAGGGSELDPEAPGVGDATPDEADGIPAVVVVALEVEVASTDVRWGRGEMLGGVEEGSTPLDGEAESVFEPGATEEFGCIVYCQVARTMRNEMSN